MKEYVFTELGYFSKQTCEKIKKDMDGKFIETDSGYIEIYN